MNVALFRFLHARAPGAGSLHARARLLILLCGGAVSVLITACGTQTYTPGPTSGLPPTTPAASSNAYIGTQSPLNWTLTIDDQQNAYNYRSLPGDGSTPATASGTFVPQSGFLNLGASGLALEMPGAGAILRPGNNSVAPVVMVEQESCLALTGKQRYLLQGMVPTASTRPVVYRRGDLVADTTPDGKTWSFADAEYFSGDASADPVSLNYNNKNAPNAFTGACATANGASSVNIDTSDPYPLPTSFRFGSAGLAVVDYKSYGSAMGVAQPLNPISTTSLVAGSFRGFQVEYVASAPTIVTQPVSFGPAVDGSVALNGGVYPNDDVTQTADTSGRFEFGSQSSSINGLFPTGSITLLDPSGGCAQNGASAGDIGVNADGIATCRLHLSAIVGQLKGKALIVASGIDLRSNNGGLQIYLVQQ